MPRFDGLGVLAMVEESDLDLSFIIVSGVIGDEVAVAAVKAGAYDYVMKDRLMRLGPAVQRALRETVSQGYWIGAFWNITDVQRMMMFENTPTRYRGTVQALAGIVLFLMMIPSIALTNGLIEVCPGNIQMVLIVVGIPVNLVVILGTIFKLKGTVQVDITAIEG